MESSQLPDPRDPKAVAEYYIKNSQEISNMRSWLTVSSTTLANTVREQGSIETEYGAWGKIIDRSGYEYPLNILSEFPFFGKVALSCEVATQEELELILSVLYEALPKDLMNRIRNSLTVEAKVDGVAVSRFINESHDEHSVSRLKELRRRKTKFGVM